MSLEDLGRRAVACKHWWWMPGMLLQWKTENGSRYRGRVCDTWSFKDEGALYCEGHEDRFTREELKAAWPDLDDPATLGCLLHLVREAHKSRFGPRRVSTQTNIRGEWYCNPNSGGPKATWYATEAEALVAALEAAP